MNPAWTSSRASSFICGVPGLPSMKHTGLSAHPLPASGQPLLVRELPSVRHLPQGAWSPLELRMGCPAASGEQDGACQHAQHCAMCLCGWFYFCLTGCAVGTALGSVLAELRVSRGTFGASSRCPTVPDPALRWEEPAAPYCRESPRRGRPAVGHMVCGHFSKGVGKVDAPFPIHFKIPAICLSVCPSIWVRGAAGQGHSGTQGALRSGSWETQGGPGGTWV